MNPITIRILHTNDFHGRLSPFKDRKVSETEKVGGASHMATAIKKLKEEAPGETLVLDAGDWAQGTYPSKITGGKVVFQVMNSLGCNATEVGNHDFDWGRKTLDGMVQEARFPVLGANVADEKTGKPIEGLTPYIIQEVHGVKVGILGLLDPDTERQTEPGNVRGIHFLSPEKTVEKYLPEMKKKGAEVIVILSHLGEPNDKKLAEKVRGIDLIVGGHSHTVLPQGERVNGILITQAGAHGEYVGEIDLQIDPVTKKILDSQAKLHTIISSQFSPDPEVEKIIAPPIREAEEKLKVVVGETRVPLIKDKAGAPTTNFPELLADAMRQRAGAEIAIVAANALTSEIEAGPITRGDLYTAIPWDEEIVTVDIPGKAILASLEYGVSNESHATMTPSGLTYSFDPRLPSRHRVANVEVNGIPLFPEKVYRVAMTTHDSRRPEYGSPAIVQTFGDLRETLEQHITCHSPITSQGEQRGRSVASLAPAKAA